MIIISSNKYYEYNNAVMTEYRDQLWHMKQTLAAFPDEAGQ